MDLWFYSCTDCGLLHCVFRKQSQETIKPYISHRNPQAHPVNLVLRKVVLLKKKQHLQFFFMCVQTISHFTHLNAKWITCLIRQAISLSCDPQWIPPSAPWKGKNIFPTLYAEWFRLTCQQYCCTPLQFCKWEEQWRTLIYLQPVTIEMFFFFNGKHL